MTLDEAITKALLPMEAVLETYGKRVSADMVRGWRLALMRRGVTDPGEIERVAGWFLAHRRPMPSPSEFCDQAIAMRPPIRVVALPPVWAEPLCLAGATPSAPRELPPPMGEDATAIERRRQVEALRGGA